jgi:mycofactocin glycosyltransferase
LTRSHDLLVPAGWQLRAARGVRLVRGGEALLGGAPLRILTLSARGAELVAGWWAGRTVGEDPPERLLARRLLDAGLVDPEPPPRRSGSVQDVTIVVPVCADPERLAGCLEPLAGASPLIVVDDGSPDGRPIAAVAERFGAGYVRHRENRGAAAARNTGLGMATTPFVAFLDADCVPPAGFPGGLTEHLGDPAVALVAPRVRSAGRLPGRIAAYERARSALDMGPYPARVRPYSSVWYVPSAAMVARRDALGRGFDEQLRLGEDVDLVWRLHDAGWQVRYDPRSTVTHEDRLQPLAWYRRRVAYNESVAPLLRRHPTRVPVMFLSPPAAVAWGLALAGLAAPVAALGGLRALRLRAVLSRYLPRAGALAARLSAEVTLHEARDLGRALAGPWSVFALGAVLARRDRALAGRLCALIIGMAVHDWLEDRPDLGPLSYGALRLADESTRGAGIWIGCLRGRDFRALRPRRPPPPSRR